MRVHPRDYVSLALASCSFSIAAMAFMGYLCNAIWAYKWTWLQERTVEMSMPTSIALMMLSFADIWSHRKKFDTPTDAEYTKRYHRDDKNS